MSILCFVSLLDGTLKATNRTANLFGLNGMPLIVHETGVDVSWVDGNQKMGTQKNSEIAPQLVNQWFVELRLPSSDFSDQFSRYVFGSIS